MLFSGFKYGLDLSSWLGGVIECKMKVALHSVIGCNVLDAVHPSGYVNNCKLEDGYQVNLSLHYTRFQAVMWTRSILLVMLTAFTLWRVTTSNQWVTSLTSSQVKFPPHVSCKYSLVACSTCSPHNVHSVYTPYCCFYPCFTNRAFYTEKIYFIQPFAL